jgi:probable rRNA maturation factor
MNVTVDIQNASAESVPDEDDIRSWISDAVNAVLPDAASSREISVRLVDSDEMADLNGRYRDKPRPTNVLSFPSELPDELELPLLGDIVICAPVVNREASEQGKTLAAHWAHMAVHGTLHLLGYDHIEDDDAQRMESLETRILVNMGLPCPYEQPPMNEQPTQ